MHPLMFVDFAMWLNPVFKVKVLKFVYDQMLKYRNDAGDAYKELGTAIGKIVSKKFMPAAMCKIAKAINYVVLMNTSTKCVTSTEKNPSNTSCSVWNAKLLCSSMMGSFTRMTR